jgi:hypothetical protein
MVRRLTITGSTEGKVIKAQNTRKEKPNKSYYLFYAEGRGEGVPIDAGEDEMKTIWMESYLNLWLHKTQTCACASSGRSGQSQGRPGSTKSA